MNKNLTASLTWVLKDEGGYAERPEEGGGAVNMGVTFTVFEAWRLKQGMPKPTWADLKAMGIPEAIAIYEAQFAKGVYFDDLPVGVDYVVLDAAVNGGVSGSIKLLQAALGLKDDGHYGLVTRWAVQHRDPKKLVDKLLELRLAKYKTFKIFNKPYKKGATKTWGMIWAERMVRVGKRATDMINSANFAAAPPIVAPQAVVVEGKPIKPVVIIPTVSGGSEVPAPPKKMPASNAISRGMIKRGFTPTQFLKYLEEEVAPQMSAWRPMGCVLHNTGKMKWPGTLPDGRVITPYQRLDNMSVHWVNAGFSGAPHLVISPDGLIWASWPLWKKGTHSPSFNSTYWGIEMVGDYRTEKFPKPLKEATEVAIAGLYSMIGKAPTDANFKFHLEDPRTSHRHCPGKNAGTKKSWLTNVNRVMVDLDPSDHRYK